MLVRQMLNYVGYADVIIMNTLPYIEQLGTAIEHFLVENVYLCTEHR